MGVERDRERLETILRVIADVERRFVWAASQELEPIKAMRLAELTRLRDAEA